MVDFCQYALGDQEREVATLRSGPASSKEILLKHDIVFGEEANMVSCVVNYWIVQFTFDAVDRPDSSDKTSVVSPSRLFALIEEPKDHLFASILNNSANFIIYDAYTLAKLGGIPIDIAAKDCLCFGSRARSIITISSSSGYGEYPTTMHFTVVVKRV